MYIVIISLFQIILINKHFSTDDTISKILKHPYELQKKNRLNENVCLEWDIVDIENNNSKYRWIDRMINKYICRKIDKYVERYINI